MPESPLSVATLLSAITAVTSLFLTQGLITNATEKLVTGLASVLLPFAWSIAHAIYHGRVHAAQIHVLGPQIQAQAAVEHQAAQQASTS